MKATTKSKLFALASLASLVIVPSVLRADKGDNEAAQIKRVLLISIDGMHALDLAQYIANNPHSTLAELSGSAVNYTNASSTKPSDSFPAMMGIVTGGSPAVTGIYYDDAYNRHLSPAGHCGTHGTPIDLKEGIDIDPTALDGGGGISPAKLPLDPVTCAPVFPHSLLRVNTIFEVIKAAGLHTAYSEKRPSYDILNGPSGTGVEDLYTPEIAFDNTIKSDIKTQNFDTLRVTSVLNEIDGKNHAGTAPAPVPAIFGMNFQALNATKKNTPGGYTDSFSTPSSALSAALDFVDRSIGKFVTELKARGIYDSTAIIITAKHGETALDPARRQVVTIPALMAVINGVAGANPVKVTTKSNAFIWLGNQTKTAAVVSALAANQTSLGIGQILSGASLRLLLPDPLVDPAVPDIIVVTNTGVNFEPTLASTVLAEHGGFGENDTHVPLLVCLPGLEAATIKNPVQTRQIAPTILGLLKLDPEALQAVKLEGTDPLPGIPLIGRGNQKSE